MERDAGGETRNMYGRDAGLRRAQRLREREVGQMTVHAEPKAGHPWTFWPSSERIRVGTAVWVVLAVAGWATAAAVAAVAVRTDQAARRLAVEAGMTPVAGPGVEIVLSDATRQLRPGENPSVALVQDSDLVFLNMMLWYGGARAVAINGQRITARSTITSSGPTIVIDRRRVVGPFHIVAVGDPHVLGGVLDTRGGFVERMRESGLGVQVKTRSTLTVPPLRTEAP
jgi:hypothetical protein